MKAMTASSRTEPPLSLASVYQRISSFEKNPASGGMPAMAAVATAKVTNVTGILRASPPIFRMSCSPLTGVDHAARSQEEQGLEERVRHHVEDARRNAPTPSAINI